MGQLRARQRQPQSCRHVAAGLPFDAQLLDVFVDCLSRHPAGPLAVSASLLDADRRGRKFASVALGVVHVCMAQIGSRACAYIPEAARAEAYSDLAEQIALWRLDDDDRDSQISLMLRAGADQITSDGIELEGGAEILNLVEALVAHQREGYDLHWFARKLAAANRISWFDVQLRANGIMTQASRDARS